MHSRTLPVGAGEPLESEACARAAGLLGEGGVVAAPTDTLYGLCALALDRRGVDRIRALKGLREEDPVLLLLPDPGWARELCGPAPDYAREIMERCWPGPLTLLLPAGARVPRWIRGSHSTVAVRLPAPCPAGALARAVSAPLTATSANRHGEPALASGQAIALAFGGGVDLVLDAGPLFEALPSTILDCTGERARIVREGSLAREALDRWAGG